MPGIKPPRLTWEYIRGKADEFRRKYVVPLDSLPIPIIDIVEFELKIVPVPIPGLMEEHDIDGYLTKDLKNICIDCEIYGNHWKENRLRFTYAHECGHLILHRREVQLCQFRTPKDWARFRLDFEEEDLNWFELQAHEFAGRLLVPRDALFRELARLSAKIGEYRRRGGENEDAVVAAVSRLICGKFGVSPEVVARRIKSEKIEI